MSIFAALSSGSISVAPPQELNRRLYLDINNFARQTAFAHEFMHIYALWLGPVLLTLIFILLYIQYWFANVAKATVSLFAGGIGTLLALLANQFVGKAVRERRPYDTFQHALVLVGKTGDYSFPSDHSVIAGALLTTIIVAMYQGRKYLFTKPAFASGHKMKFMKERAAYNRYKLFISALSLLIALFLCFARVYVGAHYPGDVVAGFLEGCLIVVVVSLIRFPLYRIVSRRSNMVVARLFTMSKI